MGNNRTPGELLDELEGARLNLKKLGDDYATARRQKASIEFKYERDRAEVIAQLQADFASEKIKRMPAEDIRKALATFMVEENTMGEFLIASAEVDALDKLIKVEQSNLTGIQTELAQLRIEFTHAN